MACPPVPTRSPRTSRLARRRCGVNPHGADRHVLTAPHERCPPRTTRCVAAPQRAALTDAYARAGSWQNANLAGAVALAQSTGARLIILNTAGGHVATLTPAQHEPGHHVGHEPGRGTGTSGPGDHHGEHGPTPSPGHHEGDAVAAGPTVTATAAVRPSPVPGQDGVPVTVGGRTVDTMLVDFPPATSTPARHVGYQTPTASAAAPSLRDRADHPCICVRRGRCRHTLLAAEQRLCALRPGQRPVTRR